MCDDEQPYSGEWQANVTADGDVVDMLLGGRFKFWLSVKNARGMRDALTECIDYCEKNRRKLSGGVRKGSKKETWREL